MVKIRFSFIMFLCLSLSLNVACSKGGGKGPMMPLLAAGGGGVVDGSTGENIPGLVYSFNAVPDSVNTDAEMTVGIRVSGSGASVNESIYLSTDRSKSSDDVLIGEIMISESSEEFSLPLPCNLATGSYYLLMGSGVVSATPIEIKRGTSCDPVNYTIDAIPSTATAGADYTLSLVLSGTGTRSVSDQLYLTQSGNIDAQSILLGDVVIERDSTSVTFTIPGYAIGAYWVRFKDSGGKSNNQVTIGMGAAVSVSVSGSVSFERPSVTADTYQPDTSTVYVYPARRIRVRLIDVDGSVLAETDSDDTGNYSLSASPHGYFRIQMVSILQDPGGSYSFKVIRYELTPETGKPHVVQTDLVSTECGNGCGVDLTAMVANRGSGAFSILDVAYRFRNQVHGWNPIFNIPALTIKWSPGNAEGTYFTSEGIGCPCVYVLGHPVDSDEYDTSVIAHELNHALEFMISRIDSPGGMHTFGDYLDPRLAYSEGLANAMSAVYSGNRVYVDTNTVEGFALDLEAIPLTHEGYYSEMAIAKLVYDLIDGGADDDDAVELSPSAILQAMAGLKESDELLWLHPFLARLKDDLPSSVSDIEAVSASFGVAASADLEAAVQASPSYSMLNGNWYSTEHTCDGSTDGYPHSPPVFDVNGSGRQEPVSGYLKLSQVCGGGDRYKGSNKLFGSAFFRVRSDYSGNMIVYSREGTDTSYNDISPSYSQSEVRVWQKGILKKRCRFAEARQCRYAVEAEMVLFVEIHLVDKCVDGGSCSYRSSGEQDLNFWIDLPPAPFSGTPVYGYHDWTQDSHKIMATSESYSGDLGGVNGADSLCQIESTRNGWFAGEYKAMLVDGLQRSAVDGNITDWVFQPETYYSPLGGDIGYSDLNTRLPLPSPRNFSVTSADYWTGLDGAIWATAPYSTASSNCNKWKAGTSSYSGSYGNTFYKDYRMYTYGTSDCRNERRLICVQQ